MAEREATGKEPSEEAGTEAAKSPANSRRRGLANSLAIERRYTPDRNAMLGALRVVLGLPKAPPKWLEELRR
jgi:hypothetical protein